LLAAVLRGALAQRLARRPCEQWCRPDEAWAATVERFDLRPALRRQRADRAAASAGLPVLS